MQKMGMSSDELGAFHRALRSSHTRTIHVSVTDLTGAVQANISNVILDGEVIVDFNAEITRSATLSFLDPHHALSFDTDSPDDGALYADRMLKIDYVVWVEELSDHVHVPVFTGPLTKLDRTSGVVNVEAQGLESLGMGAMWRPLTLKKGMKKTDAIRSLLRDRAGERNFNIPDLPSRLPSTMSFSRTQRAWVNAKKIAEGMNRQLYYDARGFATLRTRPSSPVYTFRTGTGGDVVSEVAVSNVMDDVKNTIIVNGGKPKGAKTPVQAVAVAEPTHPLSPRRLGRNGSDRYLVERIDDETIRSTKEASARARTALEDRLKAVVDVTLDALPIPHLEPGDTVRVQTDAASFEFILRQFTIPLGTGDAVMSVGYNRKTSTNKKRIRRP